MQCGYWKIVSAYLPIISVFSVLAIIQADVVYRDWDVEVLHFCLDAFKVFTQERPLEAFGDGKVYPRRIDGGVVLPSSGLPMVS